MDLRAPLKFRLEAPAELAAEAQKLLAATGYLTAAVERFTDRQWSVLQAIRTLRVVPHLDGPQGRATAGAGLVELDGGALRRHGMGGVIWLVCHEAYHLWDPELQDSSHVRREGNANLYANRIKALLEKAPAIYTWGGRPPS